MTQRKAALLAAGILLGALAARAEDLNVLIITIDTLRPDRLSCYNPKYVQTPLMDGLAAKGVLFERAFAHDPMTLPSHANILLGMTALAHGVSDNSKSSVPAGAQTMAVALKAAGYATGAFVSAFPLDSRFGLNQGFDVYDDHYPSKASPGQEFTERSAERTIAAAVPWLAAQKGKWFCWVHLWDPHAPYAPPEPYATHFRNDPYSGEVAYVDVALRKLMEGADRAAGAGRTLVILTADHGESLGEHGEMTHNYFAYNSTIWVPLIITAPGIKASRVKDYVSHVDIFPTVCELLGLKKPASLQGDSLRPLLEGKTRKERLIYFESLEANQNRGWAPLRGTVANGKKYIESPVPELYDLAADFAETTNLAPKTDLTSCKKTLQDKMARDSAAALAQGVRKTDRETRERLRSLGYAASPVAPVTKSYGPEDDLKTLLPLCQKVALAADLAGQKKYADSVRLLEEVIRARKDYAGAYGQLSELYFSQGEVDKALGVLERGYASNPDNFVLVSGYGIALVKNGRFDQGIEALGKALPLFDQDAEVWDNLGLGYWKKGEYERAVEHLDAALALAPDDALINDNLGNLYVEWAIKTRNSDYIRKSVGYFDTAIATDPTLASAYNGLGGALRIMEERDKAIENWEKAIQFDPSYDYPVYNLAVAYLEKGDKATALSWCQKYLAIKGKSITPEERREIDSLIKACKK